MMSRFKGLDLVECLNIYGCNLSIVQEAVTKTIPKKKKCKKAKWYSEETLPITEERRKAKGKGECAIYTQLNAKFYKEREEGFLK